MVVGIIYRSPNQRNVLQIKKANFDKLDTDTKESYIIGDYNINLCQNNKNIVIDDRTISSKFLSGDITSYDQFYTMHGLNC